MKPGKMWLQTKPMEIRKKEKLASAMKEEK